MGLIIWDLREALSARSNPEQNAAYERWQRDLRASKEPERERRVERPGVRRDDDELEPEFDPWARLDRVGRGHEILEGGATRAPRSPSEQPAAEYDERHRKRELHSLRKRAQSLGFDLVQLDTGLVLP